MGVAGRMKFIVLKRRALKQIADIPKPVLDDRNELKFDPKKPLIPALDFEKLQKENLDTKKYYWYNHFDEVILNNGQTGKKRESFMEGTKTQIQARRLGWSRNTQVCWWFLIWGPNQKRERTTSVPW